MFISFTKYSLEGAAPETSALNPAHIVSVEPADVEAIPEIQSLVVTVTGSTFFTDRTVLEWVQNGQ